MLTFNIWRALFCHQRGHKSLFRDEELLIAGDYLVIYLAGARARYHSQHLDPFPNSNSHQVVCVMIDLSVSFHLHPVFLLMASVVCNIVFS